MSSWSELLDRAEPEEHLVQLYGGDDQLLTRNVSRYLAEGLKRGDGLVVIATSEHAEAVLRQLGHASTQASPALRDGRLVILDARATLDRFMVDGQPDRDLFRSVVGSVLHNVHARSSSGRLRAFGEMVGLLWVDGQRAAAIRLEGYWNELLSGSSCSLYCAYPIDIFDGGPETAGLEAVLSTHTHMCAGPTTMLSSPRAAR
jgi:KaiC/GvpD/RAD55 family RecA-like ATPase